MFDLFDEKRTPAGLPIRDNHGKTVVVGLTERSVATLKEFEQLYDQANLNRSTSATKVGTVAILTTDHLFLMWCLAQRTLFAFARRLVCQGHSNHQRPGPDEYCFCH